MSNKKDLEYDYGQLIGAVNNINKNPELTNKYKNQIFDEISKLLTHTENTDLMESNVGPIKIPLYDDKGFVELIDMMPRIVPKGRFADMAVVQSARISYGDTLKSLSADNNLIRFLWTNKHVTPFESVSFQIRCRMPIFVARQVMRHRLFSYNEISYRYQQPKEEFYYPPVRFQDDTNRQMSKADEDLTEEEKAKLEKERKAWRFAMNGISESAFGDYETYVNDIGVAREVARTILPQSLMTEMLIKGNLRTWLHFLKLRMEHDAQIEIQDLANAIAKVIEPRVPTTFKTFLDCDVNNMDLPGSYVEAIAEISEMIDSGEPDNITRLRQIMHRHEIKGKRKINEFLTLISKLKILDTSYSDDDMKVLLT